MRFLEWYTVFPIVLERYFFLTIRMAINNDDTNIYGIFTCFSSSVSYIYLSHNHEPIINVKLQIIVNKNFEIVLNKDPNYRETTTTNGKQEAQGLQAFARITFF